MLRIDADIIVNDKQKNPFTNPPQSIASTNWLRWDNPGVSYGKVELKTRYDTRIHSLHLLTYSATSAITEYGITRFILLT